MIAWVGKGGGRIEIVAARERIVGRLEEGSIVCENFSEGFHVCVEV